jgi:hypothetical protein
MISHRHLPIVSLEIHGAYHNLLRFSLVHVTRKEATGNISHHVLATPVDVGTVSL